MSGSAPAEPVDLPRRPGPLRDWPARHPRIVDTVVVLVACVPLGLALTLRGDPVVSVWGWLLLALTAAALMFRRRRPLTVLVVVAVCCAASPLAQPGFGFPLLPFSFALYTVASLRSAGVAIGGYAIGVGVTVLATIPSSLAGVTPPLVTVLDPFSLIAFVAGLIVKSRREHRRWLAESIEQRVAHAALTERTRIAAEMHDVVAHSLTVMVSLADGAARARRTHPARADAAVEQIAVVGRDALADMHRTLGLLRGADTRLDEDLHRSGPNLPGLDELVAGVRAAGLAVTLSRTGPPLPEDTALRQSVYRIVQEALTNTLRHAIGAQEARVRIRHEEGEVEIVVEDDGAASEGTPVPGYGIVGMGERAAAHGGEVRSGPNRSGGWRTRAVLRVAEEGTGDD